MTSELFAEAAVVPILVIDDADDAVKLAETLMHVGFKVIEITLRTPATEGD